MENRIEILCCAQGKINRSLASGTTYCCELCVNATDVFLCNITGILPNTHYISTDNFRTQKSDNSNSLDAIAWKRNGRKRFSIFSYFRLTGKKFFLRTWKNKIFCYLRIWLKISSSTLFTWKRRWISIPLLLQASRNQKQNEFLFIVKRFPQRHLTHFARCARMIWCAIWKRNWWAVLFLSVY